MKKIILSISFLLFAAVVVQAQQHDLKKLFDRYQKVDGFSMKSIKPGIDIESDEMNLMTSFISNANDMYILEFEADKGDADDYKDFSAKLNKIIKKNHFESMMEVNDEDDKVVIYFSKSGTDSITDFLLITSEEDEAVVIWATTS